MRGLDLNQRGRAQAFVCVSKCGAGQFRKVCIVKQSHFRGSLHLRPRPSRKIPRPRALADQLAGGPRSVHGRFARILLSHCRRPARSLSQRCRRARPPEGHQQRPAQRPRDLDRRSRFNPATAHSSRLAKRDKKAVKPKVRRSAA